MSGERVRTTSLDVTVNLGSPNIKSDQVPENPDDLHFPSLD
jgi:hypothetical protein